MQLAAQVAACSSMPGGRSGSLATLTLPEGLTAIGVEAFCGCTSVTMLTLPEGLTDRLGSLQAGICGEEEALAAQTAAGLTRFFWLLRRSTKALQTQQQKAKGMRMAISMTSLSFSGCDDSAEVR